MAKKPPAKQGKRKLPQAFIDAQFKPGQSGNPKGRAKNSPSLVAAIIRRLNHAELLVESGDGDQKRPPTVEELADKLLELCMKGNAVALGALEKLLDRLDGRVPVKTELTGKDGDPIQVRSERDALASRIAGLVAGQAAEEDTERAN